MNLKFEKLGVHIPEILLPKEGIDLTKWAVIACDQYTSQPEYWENVQKEVGEIGDCPSTLKITFPEIYLKDEDHDTRIDRINKTMEQYLRENVLVPQKPGFILVDRSTPHAKSRKGLIVAVDLESYDYSSDSKSLIRATEGTVLDRIPPRVRIRKNAPIETPHIMVLLDDPGRTVIERCFSNTDRYEKLYDFELMQGGGHIKGWKIEDAESLSGIADALEKLLKGGQQGSSGVRQGADSLLFAVGDGNHSLASAKAHWENIKVELLSAQSSDSCTRSGNTALPEHPARYALVELVNVHDEGLVFEPIHRVLFGIDEGIILDQLVQLYPAPQDAQYRFYPSREEMESALCRLIEDGMPDPAGKKCIHCLPFVLAGKFGILTLKNPTCNLEAGTLQSMLDELEKNAANGSCSDSATDNMPFEIDYIHGDQVVTELGSKPGCMGFYLPVLNKYALFSTVRLDGVLPKKTFSMGEAEEKRYYLECRRIRQEL